jgi:hypothetical protein
LPEYFVTGLSLIKHSLSINLLPSLLVISIWWAVLMQNYLHTPRRAPLVFCVHFSHNLLNTFFHTPVSLSCLTKSMLIIFFSKGGCSQRIFP